MPRPKNLDARKVQALKLIDHAARKHGKATDELEATIYFAVTEHGVSLREAAERAGIGHATVDRIVKKIDARRASGTGEG